MKTIKRAGLYGLMFLLYAVALQVTTVVIESLPESVLTFCYESIVSGRGKSLYLTVLVIQMVFIIAVFGRQIWRHHKVRQKNHSRQNEQERDFNPIIFNT